MNGEKDEEEIVSRVNGIFPSVTRQKKTNLTLGRRERVQKARRKNDILGKKYIEPSPSHSF